MPKAIELMKKLPSLSGNLAPKQLLYNLVFVPPQCFDCKTAEQVLNATVRKSSIFGSPSQIGNGRQKNLPLFHVGLILLNTFLYACLSLALFLHLCLRPHRFSSAANASDLFLRHHSVLPTRSLAIYEP